RRRARPEPPRWEPAAPPPRILQYGRECRRESARASTHGSQNPAAVPAPADSLPGYEFADRWRSRARLSPNEGRPRGAAEFERLWEQEDFGEPRPAPPQEPAQAEIIQRRLAEPRQRP